MSLVTLTTDFGHSDYACGILHGVIWSIAPETKIVDLTHDVPRHHTLAGALVLDRALPYFPAGTIHVVVVDPGVGTSRRPLAVKLGNQFFVGPDNGLVSIAASRMETMEYPVEYFHLNRPQFWLKEVSPVFHGRDIFAPVAAHLARGVAPEQMGTRIFDPVQLALPEPQKTREGFLAHIIHVDHFGNLSTNLPGEMLGEMAGVIILAGKARIDGISKTFGDRHPGELVALIDSAGFLSIGVVNGSAQQTLGLGVGDQITVIFSKN